MDIAEFKRLSVRVVATRNKETRAFIKAFDLTPGTSSGWAELSSADWLAWGRANEELRAAVADLQTLIRADAPWPGSSGIA